jgi:hypothetical protein
MPVALIPCHQAHLQHPLRIMASNTSREHILSPILSNNISHFVWFSSSVSMAIGCHGAAADAAGYYGDDGRQTRQRRREATPQQIISHFQPRKAFHARKRRIEKRGVNVSAGSLPYSR